MTPIMASDMTFNRTNYVTSDMTSYVICDITSDMTSKMTYEMTHDMASDMTFNRTSFLFFCFWCSISFLVSGHFVTLILEAIFLSVKCLPLCLLHVVYLLRLTSLFVMS